jgi:hypothetical protein
MLSPGANARYSPNSGDYVLATGAKAVGRLMMLDDIYAPAGNVHC